MGPDRLQRPPHSPQARTMHRAPQATTSNAMRTRRLRFPMQVEPRRHGSADSLETASHGERCHCFCVLLSCHIFGHNLLGTAENYLPCLARGGVQERVATMDGNCRRRDCFPRDGVHCLQHVPMEIRYPCAFSALLPKQLVMHRTLWAGFRAVGCGHVQQWSAALARRRLISISCRTKKADICPLRSMRETSLGARQHRLRTPRRCGIAPTLSDWCVDCAGTRSVPPRQSCVLRSQGDGKGYARR